MRLSSSHFICLWLFLLAISCSVFAEQSIVAHPSVKTSVITINSARAIFSMRVNQWPDGSSITVFVLPDSDLSHGHFAKRMLSMTPHQLRRNWDRYIYSGTGIGPVQVKDEQEMLKKIIATPGSVGYLNARLINEKVRKIGIE